MHTAHVTVFEDGEEVGQLYPGRFFYRKHETEPTTEVAMRRTIAEDVYVVLAAYDMSDQSASFQVTVNPLVNWIWFGFALLAIGTGIALLPESQFAFLASRESSPVASSAATPTALVLALLLNGIGTTTFAQIAPESYSATTELEADLQRELVCVCGDCPHYTLADCRCSTADHMRGELREQIELGQNRRGILDYFIEAYGSQEPLGAPIDEGFNRLAWLFPYLVGGGFLIMVGVTAVRWSRRTLAPAGGASPAPDAVDAELDARLDDELRNLD